MSGTHQPEPKRAAPLVLWRALRVFLATMFSLFGAPEAIAAHGVMSRKGHVLILSWLRAGEAFLRRLLFIEALAHVDNARVSARAVSKRGKPHVRQPVYFQPDKPDDWRVSFRVFEPERVRSARARNHRVRRDPISIAPAFDPERWRADSHNLGEPARDRRVAPAQPPASRLSSRQFPNAWPVAERLEAMLRAFNDPHRCARRIARALQRKPDRAARVLTPQPRHIADLFGQYFGPCDRIAEKRRRSWSPSSALADTG